MTTHRMSRTPTYTSWVEMRRRCEAEHRKDYNDYGGRGIRVCNRWQRFEAFLQDMGERPEGTSLDRLDPNKNYTPDNCRWATPKQQGLTKRQNTLVEFLGETKPLIIWAEGLGITGEALRYRLNKWGKARALTTPRCNKNGFVTGKWSAK